MIIIFIIIIAILGAIGYYLYKNKRKFLPPPPVVELNKEFDSTIDTLMPLLFAQIKKKYNF